MNIQNLTLRKKAKLGLKYKRAAFNLVFNEFRKRILRQKVSVFPVLVTFYVTNRCNLNCPMCLNASYRNSVDSVTDLRFEDIKKILPEMIKYKPLVYFTGGEPFLHKDIFEMIESLSKNNIVTSIATNGLLVAGNVDKIIESGLECISISLDHHKEEEHDKARGSGGTCSILMSGLRELLSKRKSNPSHVKIVTVIRSDNCGSLSAMYDFIESLGVNEWALQHYSFITPEVVRLIESKQAEGVTDYIDGIPVGKEGYLDEEMILKLIDQLNEIRRKSRKYKTKFYITQNVNDLFSYYRGKWPAKASSCVIPFEHITVLPDSKVTLCRSFGVGNLHNESSVMEIWKSEKTQEIQELFAKKKILASCFRCCSLNYVF